MRRNVARRKNMFSVRSVVREEPKDTMTYEDSDSEGEPTVAIPKKKKKNVLPGERLLRQLHRERVKASIDERLKKLMIRDVREAYEDSD